MCSMPTSTMPEGISRYFEAIQELQSRVIDRAVRVTVNRLLRIGVRVYMHPSTTHVKAASVDTRWAYLGTGNFDNLSLRRNNLCLRRPGQIAIPV